VRQVVIWIAYDTGFSALYLALGLL